jgi:hypothetical protein
MGVALYTEVEVMLQLMVSQPVCEGIEPTLRLVTRYYFLSEGCRLKVAVLSLSGVICHSQSIAIYQYLHQAIYIQYIQSFIQFCLSTADYALLVIISSNYRSSLDT